MDKVIGNVDKYFKPIVVGILILQLLVSIIALSSFKKVTERSGRVISTADVDRMWMSRTSKLIFPYGECWYIGYFSFR